MLQKINQQLKMEFRFLFALNIFGILLVILRQKFTGDHYYYFLWWNVFLAAIPYGISTLFRMYPAVTKKIRFWPLAAIWLLFLPNAPYIMTDLMHLAYGPDRFLWFDVLIIFTFATAGLLFGFFSLKAMGEIMIQKLGKTAGNITTSIAIFASAFGVYLGRFQRYNSWDLLHHPDKLFWDIVARFTHPMDHYRTWGVTILVGLFLHILYFGLKPNEKENLNKIS